MNILIIEDDILIAEMIKEMMIELNHHIVHISHTYEDAVDCIENSTSIELIILDIQLGKEKSGLKIAQQIYKEKKLPFIFLTSYADKSIIEEALQYRPRAYLLKPFTKLELYTTIHIIHQQEQLADTTTEFLFKDGSRHVKINTKDIYWIKSDNIYLEIQTSNEKLMIRCSIKKFLDIANDPKLKRVHRSYVIHIDKIESVYGNYIIVHNQQIPITRNSKDEIVSSFD